MSRKRTGARKGPARRKPRAYPRGRFEATSQGYGFVSTPEGDFFIPKSRTRGAFDGDLVEVSVVGSAPPRQYTGRRAKARQQKQEAHVKRVIERGCQTLIGRYEIAGPFGVVVPDDPKIRHDIFTLRSESPDVEDGSLVRVRILEYPTPKTSATGIVEAVLGSADDDSLAIERIIARNNIETVFGEEALREAQECELDIEGALDRGYRDIRDRFVFTIDPADAKDFDDALSIEELDDGTYKLGVHIADVSAYVRWDSFLDLEARKRATSVYLVDRVIPMLPESLSNGLCSLKPDEDRLCVTAEMHIDEHANLIDFDLYPAVMRSKLRLTYDEALDILAGSKEAPSQEVARKLELASRFAKCRQRIRDANGGIEFGTKEAKVILNDSGKPVSIEVREKNAATQLIEEAMIFANEVVATYLERMGWPCAYRDHDAPSADTLSGLIPTLQEFKWFTRSDAERLVTGNPHAIQKVLDEAAGRAEYDLVTMLVLRAMMRAVYSPENIGHYGLGLSAYCHFTSPIRRYPDLMVHRMLKRSLKPGAVPPKKMASSLKWICEHSSEMERVAETASFDSQKVKIVEFMQPYVGEEFDAVITGVASYGMYVRLDNCAEGLVPISTLGSEYFAYDEERNRLRGTDTNTVYRLGQQVRVILTKADPQQVHLDFKVVT